MLRDSGIIVTDSNGFLIRRGGTDVVRGGWADVVQVRAFVRDEITVDTVCASAGLQDNREVLLEEDVPGWRDWRRTAETARPALLEREAWWPAVTRPAFTPGVMVRFER